MGAGFSMDAINVIRGNKSLLKKRKFKDIKQLLLKTSNKTELEFKLVCPQELELIKQKIRRQSRKDKRSEALIYVLSAFLAFVIIYLLYWIS